jgi:LacI family transcriptional regulator
MWYNTGMKRLPKVILLLEAARGFDRGLLRGISRYASLHGPWIFYREPPRYLRAGRNLNSLAEMKEWAAEGMICPAVRLREARELGVPCVIYGVNEDLRDFASIVSDNAGAGRLAARHLWETGLRQFAFYGLAGMRWSDQREERFCREISNLGGSVRVFQPPRRSSDREDRFLKKWLKSLPRPTGLFCANDDRAAGIAELCRTLGLRVPEDIAILGVDNDEFVCELSHPPLSSVAMGTEQAGYRAARLLARLMTGREKRKGQKITAFATGVATRQSTDLLATDDEPVGDALRFIRQNQNRLISVGEVVEASKLSHRTLNDRFHMAIGHSILQEINRVRAQHIARLLMETNLSIKQIARSLGYSSNAHIARYFNRITGLTPLAYRQKQGQ